MKTASTDISSSSDPAKHGIILSADCPEPAAGSVSRAENWFESRSAWVFPGKDQADSLRIVTSALPGRYVRIEAEIAAPQSQEGACDVYRLRLVQPGREEMQTDVPVLNPVKPLRTIVLEPFYEADPSLPLEIRIDRENQDPRNTFHAPTGVLAVRIVPVQAPGENLTVPSVPGYNSWPFIQFLKDKLVCVYSRGMQHSIGERNRGVYARTSSDDGKTWSPESLVVNTPESSESAIGKGADSTGAALIWVRCVGENWHHDLYRTGDGVRFQRIAELRPDPMPMQITDIFSVPGVGLMSLWFAGVYTEGPVHSWGTLTSRDDGKTWEQKTVESGLEKQDWPTEPSAVYLGSGRIIVIARVEGKLPVSGRAQFQLESADYGKTWKRMKTNITDVHESTPSLIPDRGKLCLYYYQRGTGQLKCRIADPDFIWDNPLCWPAPEIVALGSREWHHAGNVNAVSHGNSHFLVFYTGNESETGIVLAKTQPHRNPVSV